MSATTRNTMIELMNRPQVMATVLPSLSVPRTVWIDEKSIPPRAQPMGGMMIPLTSCVTTPPSAAPRMTPMASARAFDLVRKSRNPLIVASVLDDLREVLRLGDPAGDLGLGRDAPDDARAGGHDFLEGDREVGGVALGQLARR